jgi:hypothetical protein
MGGMKLRYDMVIEYTLARAVLHAWYHAWKYMYSSDEYKQLTKTGRAPHERHTERQDDRQHVRTKNNNETGA